MDRVERAISAAIQPALHQHGFGLRKDWGYFVRDQAYGFDALLIVNQGTAKGRFFEIKCYAEVRHDRIEVPWNTLGLVYGEDNQRQTWTLNYKEMGGPQAAPMHVAPDSMTADVERIAREVSTLFAQSGLPFYRRFGDLREVESWANEKPLAEINPSVGGPMEHRAMRSLLLAKAVNPTRYAKVREAFVTLDQGMFPREKRLGLLAQVDEMTL